MSEAETSGTSTLAVHRGTWEGLPADIAAMVAPPVTVSAFPLAEPSAARRRAREAQLRKNMPSMTGYGRNHRPN